MMVNYRVLLVFFYQFWAVFATGPDLLSLDFLSTKYFGIVGAVVFGQPAPEPRRYGTPGARPQHNLPARAQLVRQQVRPPSSKIGFRWVRLG